MLLAAVLGIGATGSLGSWQLDRAAQKRSLQAAIEARALEAPLDNATLRVRPTAAQGEVAAVLHRPARLTGTWSAAHTVYLDNRPMDGRVGFFVVTPLKLAGRDEAVLVQRGWVPRNAAQRDALPPVDTPAGEVHITGRLAATPSRVYALGPAEQGGAIRQNVDLSAFAAETGLRLLPLVLLQTDDASAPAAPAGTDGLRRHWPAPAVDLHKHYGYAFQWFALAALILGLYVWFQVLAPYRRRRTGRRRDADAA